MSKKRSEDIKAMSDNIEDQESKTVSDFDYVSTPSVNPEDMLIKKLPEIVQKEITIPKCNIQPINGRIYVIEEKSNAVKSRSGLLLPFTMAIKKDDSVTAVNRYFVVTWAGDIPKEISDQLAVGTEIYPFFPEEALNWSIPRIIDWSTGIEFKVVHYTELSGISRIKPVELSDE